MVVTLDEDGGFTVPSAVLHAQRWTAGETLIITSDEHGPDLVPELLAAHDGHAAERRVLVRAEPRVNLPVGAFTPATAACLRASRTTRATPSCVSATSGSRASHTWNGFPGVLHECMTCAAPTGVFGYVSHATVWRSALAGDSWYYLRTAGRPAQARTRPPGATTAGYLTVRTRRMASATRTPMAM